MKTSPPDALSELLEQTRLVKDPHKLKEIAIEIGRLIAEWDARECRALVSELTQELAARRRSR